MFEKLKVINSYFVQTANLMVGLPSYQNYLDHMAKTHADKPVMDYETFFRERQAARYGEGATRMSRCC
ncbi:MAG: putative selenoprotein [Betaproteobacteria bacterium]|nr:putative selenoprotein [Betaproteobacteria bacterium]